MKRRRFVVVLILTLAVMAASVGAGSAFLGKYKWGDASWYYRRDSEYRLRCGEAALRAGDLARAEEVAGALQAAGHEEHAALLRGEVLFHRAKPLAEANRLAEASPLLLRTVAELEKIKSLGPVRVQAVAIFGRCSLYLGNPREAERAFQYVLHEEPDHTDAHRGLAALYYDQGAMVQSISHLEKVAELEPHDGRPHRLIGLIYKDLQQYGSAVDAYREALRRQISFEEATAARKELAESLIKQTRYAEGLEVAQQIDPPDDDRPAFAALQAQALMGLDRTDQARAVLDEVLRHDSSCADLYRLRGQLYVHTNEPQAAAPLLERAVALDPNDYGCRNELVVAYKMLGRNAEAADQQNKLMATQRNIELMARLNQEALSKPWDASVRRKMADVSEQLGKWRDARMWRRAADACPASGPAP
jgi:tetratricopeptide (TPR) repeat protein